MSQTYTIKECLRGYTTDALGAICDQWQLAASSKPSRIRAIEKILQDPLHIKQKLAETSPDQLRLLHLAASRPDLSSADLLHVPGLYSLKGMPVTLKEAATQGLLLVTPQGQAGAFTFNQLHRDRNIGESAPRVFVPELVAQYLPPAPALGVSIPAVAPPDSGAIQGLGDRATMLFLETLRIVEVLQPRVTANGTIHKSDEVRAQELAREAGLPNDGLNFALMVARELHAIEAKRGRLTTTALSDQWSKMARPDRMKHLFEGYLAAQDLPDVRLFFPQLFPVMEEHLEPGSLRRTYHRALMAQVLREQPEGLWHSVAAFAHAIHQIDRNLFFLEERWRAIQANVRDPNSAWKDHQWQMREKRLLCWMVQSLLHDMGMVELADDGALFRVTPIGRYALGVGPLPSDANGDAHDALIVQPDFEVMVYLDRCTPDLRRKMDTFCERVRGGEVSTYRITQESVYRGVRGGTTTEEFIALLERHSKTELPSNVRAQFNAWKRKAESIQVHTGCNLIECATEAEADSLLAECNGSRRIGGRFILVHGPHPEVDAKINYRRVRRACLSQEEGLCIRLPWAKQDLFIRRRLEEMGELESDGDDFVLHLSQTKLKRREDWSLYAAQLETLTERPLAARYRVALRAWSGDLGTAHSGNAAIVRFDAPELCEAAMEFPEVASFIEGRLGLFALVIAQGKLAKFKKALRERGIVVKNDDAITDTGSPEEWAIRWLEEHQQVQAALELGADDTELDDEDETEAAGLPSYSPRIIREILDDAITRRRPVLIEYQSAYSKRPTIRRVDPVTLDMSAAVPTLSGYCHHHQGPRVFKLTRVTGIRVLEDETF